MLILIAVGLLLTSATQFRLRGLGLGPGEVCLVLWIALTAVRELLRGGPPVTPALSRMFRFWMLIALAEALGALNGYAMGDPHDTALFRHDLLAYPLVGAVGCLLLAGPQAEVRLHRLARVFLMLAAVALTLQLAAAWGILRISFIEPWFGNRFRGWSSNSNQLAFFCAVYVLVALHIADSARRPRQRVGAVVCSIPAIVVGHLTKTDSFTFALAAALPLFLVMKLRMWTILSVPPRAFRPTLAALVVLAAPLLLISFAPLVASAVGHPESLAMGVMKGGGKEAAHETDLRLELWSLAVQRGLEANMLGLGPGPHLPMPSSIVAARAMDSTPDVDSHPALGGVPNFEAHNTPLDLFTQGGLIAVLALAWLMTSSFLISCREQAAGLSALVCGLAVFSMTNFTLREPMFWFGIALCLAPAHTLLGRRQAVEASSYHRTLGPHS